jgi:hypothetical protein
MGLLRLIRDIWRKRLSPKEQMRLQIRDSFDDCVKSREVRAFMTGEPMLDGMLLQSAIATTYKSLNESQEFRMMSLMCNAKYHFDPLIILEEELDRALLRYCGIKRRSFDDEFDYLDEFDED